MMSGMYAAISGLEVNQTALNVTANNLSNVNTVGYKSATIAFADSLTQVLRGATGSGTASGGTNPVQVGLGVQVSSTHNEMNEGAFQPTGNPLDIAIEGTGFLRVGPGTPPEAAPFTENVPKLIDYTRAGNLETDSNGFLTTASGQYVVGFNAVEEAVPGGIAYKPGAEESYLHIPPGSTDVEIGQDGSVNYVDENPVSPTFGQQVTAGYITLAQFPNEAGLERLGGSLWGATANSGKPVIGVPGENGLGSTIGGELEMSNVNLAGEMAAMITAERGYQSNSRVITTADEMLQSAVSMVQ